MKKRISKNLLCIMFVLINCLFIPADISFAEEDVKPNIETSSPGDFLKEVKNQTDLYADQNPEEGYIEDAAASLVETFLIYLGIIFLIVTLYAGVNWILSRGDIEKITKSKSILKYSVIGMIVISFAYTISSFILTSSEKIKTPNTTNDCSIFTTPNECEKHPECEWKKSNIEDTCVFR